ncbi:MAG: hypothetical protein QOE65_2761 [Solirubrobacteraceae bacterium]|nr:hypothetical protein [Solirubrobacteraceae bacterium]
MKRSTLAALAACVLLAACGKDGNEGKGGGPATGPNTSGTVTTPSATTPSVPTAPPTAPPTTAPRSGGGGGDEEPIRIPAQFTLRGGKLRPQSVSVPAFLAIDFSVRNLDAIPRLVTLRADRTYRLRISARGRAARLVPGQRAGTYPVVVAGGGLAVLVSGGEPGP